MLQNSNNIEKRERTPRIFKIEIPEIGEAERELSEIEEKDWEVDVSPVYAESSPSVFCRIVLNKDLIPPEFYDPIIGHEIAERKEEEEMVKRREPGITHISQVNPAHYKALLVEREIAMRKGILEDYKRFFRERIRPYILSRIDRIADPQKRGIFLTIFERQSKLREELGLE